MENRKIEEKLESYLEKKLKQEYFWITSSQGTSVKFNLVFFNEPKMDIDDYGMTYFLDEKENVLSFGIFVPTDLGLSNNFNDPIIFSARCMKVYLPFSEVLRRGNYTLEKKILQCGDGDYRYEVVLKPKELEISKSNENSFMKDFINADDARKNVEDAMKQPVHPLCLEELQEIQKLILDYSSKGVDSFESPFLLRKDTIKFLEKKNYCVTPLTKDNILSSNSSEIVGYIISF